MATLTIRLPDDKAERLKNLAATRDISVNKMFEEWATIALAEFDTRAGFMARAAQGSAARGLELIATMNAREASDVGASHGFHDHNSGQSPYKQSSYQPPDKDDK